MKDMPDGWKESRLKEIFELRKGKKINITDMPSKESIPYIAIENLRGEPISKFTNDDNGLMCNPSDLLLVWDGANCGTVGFGLNGFVGSTITRLRKIDNCINENYAFKFLKSKFKYFNTHTTGATIPHLEKNSVINLMITIPPIDIQKKIVTVLEKAKQLKEWRKESDKLTDDYLNSVFLEMFGDPITNPKSWEFTKLDNLLEKSINGLYLPKDKYVKVGGVEMIHMTDAFYGNVHRGGLKRVMLSEKEINKYNVDYNDILIARRSLNYEGSAKPCRVPESDEPIVFESSLIKITPNLKKISPSFLFYYLNNERVRKFFVFKFVTKSTISGINQEGLKRIEIIVPPLDLQYEFENIIKKIEKLKKIQIGSKQQIENFFDSLMQKAFRGELIC